jgi:hypothetical protein
LSEDTELFARFSDGSVSIGHSVLTYPGLGFGAHEFFFGSL